jgi:hypothetical protein
MGTRLQTKTTGDIRGLESDREVYLTSSMAEVAREDRSCYYLSSFHRLVGLPTRSQISSAIQVSH